MVVFHTGVTHELGVELIALRMGDDEIDISSIHPLGKGVGHSLWQGTAMGSPSEDDLGFSLTSPKLLDGDEVGEGLQGVHRGCLHGEDGLTAVFDKLVEHRLGIVILTIGESGKRAYTNYVAVATHNGNGLQQMLALVSVHDDATLGFEFPGTGIDVEHDDVHAEVHGSLLRGKTGTQ